MTDGSTPLFTRLADGVYVARFRDRLDVNVGLVVGSERALVVDTGWSEPMGAEIARAVEAITPLEQVVVVTHAHFDHSFGAMAFRDSQVWGHIDIAPALESTAEQQRDEWAGRLREQGRTAAAAEVEAAEVLVPHYLIDADTRVDLGGREIVLVAPGPAHTDHDLLVAVPDAGVAFWGDVVEEGAEPSVGDDSDLDSWPGVLRDLARHPDMSACPLVIPGHGGPLGLDDVAAQADLLEAKQR